MIDLSILIPARNEEFLARTVQDILEHAEGNIEVIAVLDGYLPNPSLKPDERCVLIYNPESVGQRAATNQAAKIARGKYLMKVDAHCSFDQGFDVKMLEAIKGHDDWTMAPMMRNLHAFDWVCDNAQPRQHMNGGDEPHRRYQGPSGPCKEKDCGKPTHKEVIWWAKTSPKSTSFCFDSEPHFQYFNEYCKRPEAQGDITESMSLQGSCFMLTKEKYFELDICSEEFGSWGSQGLEVAIKTWLSGGKVMINHKTWYAHMFRTQGGDFGFPYQLSGGQIQRAKQHAKDLFFRNKWPKQKHPLAWLVEKFWPVKGWTQEDLDNLKKDFSKGIIFYTDNALPLKIAHEVQDQLSKVAKAQGLKIVSSSLKKMDFGDKNIHFPHLKRGYLTMAKQILGALENSDADVIFFCEHDVLYPEEHFKFTPPDKNKFYYNRNFWKIRLTDGHAIHFDADQLSGMCAYRDILIPKYQQLVDWLEHNEYSPKTYSFEPGTREGTSESWFSDKPIVDLRHGGNLTRDRWHPEEFRDPKACPNWMESDEEIPGWGKTKETFKKLLETS